MSLLVKCDNVVSFKTEKNLNKFQHTTFLHHSFSFSRHASINKILVSHSMHGDLFLRMLVGNKVHPWDSSVGNNACLWVWQPKFEHQDLHGWDNQHTSLPSGLNLYTIVYMCSTKHTLYKQTNNKQMNQ